MKIQLLKDMLDSLSSGIIVLNLEKEVIFANKIVKDYFHSETGKKIGNYIKCIYIQELKEECQKSRSCKKCLLNSSIDIAVESKELQILSEVKFNFNNKSIILTCKINYIPNEEIIIIELLNLSKKEDRLEFLLKAFDKSRDMLFFKNSNLQYEYVNNFGVEIFNLDKGDILGKTDTEIMDNKNAIKCLKGDLEALTNGKSVEIESIGGRLFKVEKEHLNGGILGVARDITDEIEATQNAEMDSLTDLYNRRKFIKVIDKIYEEKIVGEEFYLSLIDLDDLRTLNNEYGHLKGDEYLIKIGEILNSYPEGMFFRLGGDEFAGIIPRDKIHVENIFKSIFKKIDILRLSPTLSISVGIKKMDLNRSYLENFSQVDKILYKVKRNGKNKYLIEE